MSGLCGSKRDPKHARQQRFVASQSATMRATMLTAVANGGAPVLIGRLGSTEAQETVNIAEGRTPHPALAANSGVFASSNESVWPTWRAFMSEYLAAVRDADMMQLWPLQCPESVAFMCYFNVVRPLTFYHGGLLELLDLAEALARRRARVLVVSPWASSIARNLPNLHLIHPSRNLTGLRVRVLRAPLTYTPTWHAFSIANKLFNWTDALAALKNAASHEWSLGTRRARSHVVLLGCGAYGMPLAAHAKRAGLSSIYLGGALQLLFGIRGARWDSILPSGTVNEYWTRPSAAESSSAVTNEKWRMWGERGKIYTPYT